VSQYTTYAFESENGAAARSDRSRTEKYGEDAPELISHFMAESLWKRSVLLSFEKGGA